MTTSPEIPRRRCAACEPNEVSSLSATNGFTHEFFVSLIHDVAPERASEIDTLIATHGITFVADETSVDVHFRTDPVTRQIMVSTQPVYMLWFNAWAYALVYEGICQAQASEPPVTRVADVADPKFILALNTLEWVTRCELARRRNSSAETIAEEPPRPTGTPVPFDQDTQDVHCRLATDLTLMALGWILFHEVGHVRLKHRAIRSDSAPDELATSHEQEKDADSWAANFVLDHVEQYCKLEGPERTACCDLVRLKRQEAIAVALVWLVKFECHFGVRSGSNHPPTYDRLSRILAAFEPAPNELVWAISSTALHLHMHMAGFRTPAREFESFREFLSFLCDELSRRPLRL